MLEMVDTITLLLYNHLLATKAFFPTLLYSLSLNISFSNYFAGFLSIFFQSLNSGLKHYFLAPVHPRTIMKISFVELTFTESGRQIVTF